MNKAPSSHVDVPDNTRDRILDQAEILFAEKGFNTVSIREITTAASCNLAAVNYHFGNKLNLYMDVFRERWLPRARGVQKAFADTLSRQESPSIQDIISAMAGAFLSGPMTDVDRRHHVQLMQRELSNPTEALNLVIGEVIEPFNIQLHQLIEPHLLPGVDKKRLTLFILSVIGMTLYFSFARPVVTHLTGCTYDDAFKKQLVSHIALFSMDGIHAIAREGKLPC